jgi:ribulose-5-phosphate 4-epimerase/fuculose-1-phosphate aldolase
LLGDNFEKDVVGAVDLNIFTYWFTKNSDNSEKYKTFHNYKILLSDFQSMYDDLIELKKISKYCGERFDLVQAGGGNTSVKTINNWLVIKASGYNLTSVDTKNGYVVMDNQKLVNYIESNRVNDVLIYNAIGTKRASIETFMHSILQKYTIHLHPVQINRVLVSKDARDIINKIYPNSLIIDYLTPGIQVCNKIKELYCDQKVIFLLNHGIIITSDKIQEIYEILEDILMKFEHEQQLSGFDRYKFTNNISSAINTKFCLDNVTYLVEDSLISKYLIENKRLFDSQITFPDAVVYCGVSKLHGIKNIDTSIECPKIIIENNFVYINANTLAKCKDIQDVLKSELIILDSILDKNYLLDSEI